MASTNTVRLTVKAANGAVEDFRVDAQAEWTVQELKTHLYRHYPTHPPLTSQRLIHSGRLLLDHEKISDVAPGPRENPVVVHLVAYERSMSAPAIVTPKTTPHPRQASRQPSLAPVEEAEPAERGNSPNTTPAAAQPQHTQTQRQQTNGNEPPTANPWLRYRAPPQGYQPLRLGGAPPVQNLPMFAPGMAGYPFSPFYMSPYGAAYAAQMTQWYQNYYGRQGPDGAVDGRGVEDEDIDLQNQQEVQNDQDIEEDVAVNAGGLGLMGGGVNLQRQRDLVDYVYMFMMAGFLASMAYFTASLGRLLIVVGGVIFMLLNQAGWFSLQRRRQVRPFEDARPQEPQFEARGEEEEQPPLQEDGGQREEGEGTDRGGQEPREEEGGTELPADESTDSIEVQQPILPPQEPQRPGLLATVFVFVTSFFSSLVPQQRPELQMN